jgi:hypothetical protein
VAEVILAEFPWSHTQATRGTDKFGLGLAAAEAGDTAQLENVAEQLRQRVNIGSSNSAIANYAAILYAHLALFEAQKGNDDSYQNAAMKVGGLVSRSRSSASRTVLLRLAEASNALGQSDIAYEYVEQSEVRGAEREAVLAQIATSLFRENRNEEAKELLDSVFDGAALVGVRCAAASAEVRASTELSAIFTSIESQRTAAEKGASLVGVAQALLEQP